MTALRDRLGAALLMLALLACCIDLDVIWPPR